MDLNPGKIGEWSGQALQMLSKHTSNNNLEKSTREAAGEVQKNKGR